MSLFVFVPTLLERAISDETVVYDSLTTGISDFFWKYYNFCYNKILNKKRGVNQNYKKKIIIML